MNTVSLRKTRAVVYAQDRFLGEQLVPKLNAMGAAIAELDKAAEPLRRPLLGRLKWLLTGR